MCIGIFPVDVSGFLDKACFALRFKPVIDVRQLLCAQCKSSGLRVLYSGQVTILLELEY